MTARTFCARLILGTRRIGQHLRGAGDQGFLSEVLAMVWEYRAYSIAVLAVTVVQEFVALWPVQLLGEFVDRLEGGDIGNVVFMFMGASLLYPAIARGNVILRHKMFYESDFQKRVELTLQAAHDGAARDPEAAAAVHSSIVQAVSGLTNAMYQLLGGFAPVIIKIIIVTGRLLEYNQLLGLAYLASLTIPSALTILFNNHLSILRDSQYSLINKTSGAGIKTIVERGDPTVADRFQLAMRERTNILFSLLARSQIFLYVREATLIGSQFLVVFLALSLRDRIGMTPGDFTQVIGYTGQVAGVFLNAVSFVDNIFSYSRAYHVYRQDLVTTRPR